MGGIKVELGVKIECCKGQVNYFLGIFTIYSQLSQLQRTSKLFLWHVYNIFTANPEPTQWKIGRKNLVYAFNISVVQHV